jgi:hypothetical protein
MRAILVFAGLLAATPVSAGTISIVLSQQGELRGSELAVDLTVENGGDEPARAITPRLRFGGREARGETRDLLVPGFPFEATVSLAAGDLGPGRWPYRLVVDYTDANQYPFQALQVATVEIGDAPPVKVAVPRFDAAQLVDSGALELQVKNLSAQPRSLQLELVAPEALEVTQGDRQLELAPWQERSASFQVTNRTALPGSRLPVFVTLEYSDGDVHQALVAQSSVEIRAPGSAGAGGVGRRLAIALAALGVLAVGWLALRRRR